MVLGGRELQLAARISSDESGIALVAQRAFSEERGRAFSETGLKLLKIGALVRVSGRRIKIAMTSACPHQNEFADAHFRVTAAVR